jgi:tyrosyl-tRNA synthetase
VLSAEDTLRNSAGYFDQLMRILREDRTEIRHNSEWLAELNFSDVLGYSRMLTVARLLERDDFSKRYKSGQAISLMEFMYPMMQGLDSVFIESDVELGGTDQTYNNLVGRTLQTQLGQPGQTVLTVPLLRGTDGADKMGKSLGNWIAISEEPNEQYGKIVAISDDLVAHYAELCCGWTAEEIAANATQFTTDPFGAKRSVAHRIVELYHGEEAAAGAADHFDRRFRQRELVTDDLQQFTLDAADPVDLITLLVDSGLCSSKGEARRMLAAGAVRINGTKADPSSPTLPRAELSGAVLQRGKLNAVRLSA